MIPYEEVRATILAAVPRLAEVDVAPRGALGLALARDVHAREPVPPFANTAMDGYAVRAADTAGARADAPVRLRVVGELRAGQAPSTPVGRGEAIRIMTGAPMPDGADAIVIVELTAVDGDGVMVQRASQVGEHVRGAGGDVREGELVFRAGTVLGPAHIGVLTSIGVEAVPVVRRARVGVVSTGDELVEHGPLRAGAIRDSNRPMLVALLEEAGVQPLDLGIARDDEAIMTATLAAALERCDAVVTSGGVSVGDYDFVHVALGALAGHDTAGAFHAYQVAIKPAKPLAFGVVRNTPVFGLPGNPVSSRVSFELFTRPALLQMMGHPARFRPEVVARLAEPIRRKVDGKVHFDRVDVRVVDGRYVATAARSQDSNALAATARANGLALVPDGDGVDADEEITVMLLDAAPDH